MTAAAAPDRSWVAAIRAALAPSPGRWREALLVGAATSTALALATVFQVPNFAGPNVTFAALQATTVCTWRNMVRRLVILCVAGLVMVPLGGALVQAPWLMVPVFFVTVAVLTYGIPAARNPVESILVAFPLITAFFSGTYDPTGIAVEMRTLVASCAIGVVVATAFAQLSSRRGPRIHLTTSIANSYARTRSRLARAIAAYQSDAPPVATEGEAPLFSDLGSHVQLLDLVRQEGIPPATERTLVTLVTAAERIESFIGTIETLSLQDAARTYRNAVAGEIAALVAAIDHALACFETAARRLAHESASDPRAQHEPWPDLSALIAALHARQLELRASREFARIEVAESASTNALLQSLTSIADVLHTPPWRLHELAEAERLEAPGVWPWSMLPIDRFALRYAVQVAIGATISLVVGIASHVPQLSTLLWDSLLVAQLSYGATIRKAWLRLGGVILGGVLAILTMVLVFANSNDVTTWLLTLFVLAALLQYAILGAGAYFYGPFQVGVTYFVVLIGEAPSADVEAALWRAFGTFTGTAILFMVFRLIAPDYAGRQLVARFADLLRTSLRYVPRAGEVLPPLNELVTARLAVARWSADILRLIDEARLEGRASGIDPTAAVEAAGVAMRITMRTGLIARGRATIRWPALEPRAAAALEDLRQAVRARLAHDLEVLEARHTMAEPGTRAHDAACDVAAERSARARTELQAPLAAATDALAEARRGEIMQWPPDASSALLAELDHLHRIVQLLPRLDAALSQTILPAERHAARLEAAPQVALTPSVTRP